MLENVDLAPRPTAARGKRGLLPIASLTLGACLALATVAAACGDDTGTGGSAAGGNPAAGGAGAGTSNGGNVSDGGGGNVSEGGGGGVSDGGNGGSGGAPTGGAGCGPLPALPEDVTPDEFPQLLSETGLYSDFANETLADYILEYTPRYPLWTDGATKERWAYIPPNECDGPIDNSDIDTWQVPVGSRFWKEFTRDGVRIETRFIIRTGPDASDFKFATYRWDGSGDAVKIDNGLDDANGTGHDIPPVTLCSGCHKSDWRVLGFSAIQLTGNPGTVNMASLSADGVLSNPLPGGVSIPGNDVEREALGCMHVNCGSCHYDGGVAQTAMHLRVKAAMTTVATTDTFLTAVNRQTNNYNCNSTGGLCDFIEPMSPATSATWERMDVEGDGVSQMPPYGTELENTDCRSKVGLWINQLPLNANP